MSGIDFTTVLYRQLPEVFRDRDNPVRGADGTATAPGDLVRLLQGFGDLQSALYRTLLQRYYDIFPDQQGVDDEGLARGCQPWVLPYLAQLLDVSPLSPLESGQRAEVANAVAWRQRKGTLVASGRIADQVGGIQTQVQEGWRLLAVTARPGQALLPASSFGVAEPRPASPAMTGLPGLGPLYARHPALPNGTVDLRFASRAVRNPAYDPAAAGVPILQAQPHGVPCLPDSYQDVSARTADVRTPDWRHGHVHPRRAVVHAAPFEGFFADDAASVAWPDIEAAVAAGGPLPASLPLALVHGDDDSVALSGVGDSPVRITGAVTLAEDRAWRFQNLWFDAALQAQAGHLQLTGCAALGVEHAGTDTSQALISARACLLQDVVAASGRVSLEYCTVLGHVGTLALTASDCILMTLPDAGADATDPGVPMDGCIRFSRLPLPPSSPWPPLAAGSNLRVAPSCSFAAPVFVEPAFGLRGGGVLHPGTPPVIRFGAEDSAEMGAYHDLHYTLREQAVLDKLGDFMPVGIEPVLVPDDSLLCAPPAAA